MPGVSLIVAGGAHPEPSVVAALPEVGRCIAADSGADHAFDLGLDVDVVVGDLDSISPAGLDRVRSLGLAIRSSPTAKDQTDLELAIEVALEQVGDEHHDKIIVIGLGGGRLDHALANVTALADIAERAAALGRDVEVDGLIGSARLSVVRAHRELSGALGETVSLLPLLGSVDGVTTTGLEFPLDDEPLLAGSGRGMSNRFVARQATVEVRQGTLVAIQPFALRERLTR